MIIEYKYYIMEIDIYLIYSNNLTYVFILDIGVHCYHTNISRTCLILYLYLNNI